MQTKTALLTTGAALLIAGAAVIGGTYVDRHSMQTASMESENFGPPHSVTVPPPKVAVLTPRTTTTQTVTTTTPGATQREIMREPVMDKSLVALKGTVTDKKGNVLMIKDASGPVRVVVREDLPRALDTVRAVSAMDKVEVGDAVTIYGTLRTNEDMPKVYAEAIYTPATKTLYHVNGDRPATQLTSSEITSRYTPVNSVHATRITTTTAMTER
jgi:hypothetical protein